MISRVMTTGDLQETGRIVVDEKAVEAVEAVQRAEIPLRNDWKN